MLASYITVDLISSMMFDSSVLCCLLSCWSDFLELFQKDWHLLSRFNLLGSGQPASGRLHVRVQPSRMLIELNHPELNEA